MGRLEELQKARAEIQYEIDKFRPQTDGETWAAKADPNPEDLIKELFTYHPPKDEITLLKYEVLRNTARHMALMIWKVCPPGKDRAEAIAKLRETVMTANAAIALNGVSL